MRNQKTRKHLHKGGDWFGFGKSQPKSITNTKIGYSKQGDEASMLRAQSSQIGTVASLAAVTTAATSVSMMAVGASLGIAGLVVPPVLPVMIAILVGTAFIMRQKGLNEELRANLYFIKMEVERMFRSMRVINSIARERKIPLNTVSLSTIMLKLQDKIMLFADRKTKEDIKQLEEYLRKGELTKVTEIIEGAQKDSDAMMKQGILRTTSTTKTGGGIFRWLPTGWSSRWISPDETLRQIIRDITIAVVWYSIMLSEFDIFNKYMDIKTKDRATQWIERPEMNELLIANQQLNFPRGEAEKKLQAELANLNTKPSSKEINERKRMINEELAVLSNHDFFYDPSALKTAVDLVKTAGLPEAQDAAMRAIAADAPTSSNTDPSTSPTTPSGGTRRKRYSQRF